MRVPALRSPLKVPLPFWMYSSLFAVTISLQPFTLPTAAAQVPVAQDPSFTAFSTQSRAESLPTSPAQAPSSSLAMQQLAAESSPFAMPPLQDRHLESDRLAPTGRDGSAASSLPEAPGPAIIQPASPSAHTAPLYRKDIPPGWQAQPLGARDKIVLGLRDLYTPGNFGAMFISSGYSHLTNRQPNYGTDRGAYGERLGAAALRETSQGFLTDSVFAPLLHQDPRYYVLGPQHSTFHRALYALTRPLIRRNDDGRETVNTSLLLGYASAAALTNTYYPAINRNARDTTATFGASIGGAALGFLVSEYADQILVATHLRRPE
jgi:hypothetical protein